LNCLIIELSIRIYKEIDAIISGGIEIRGAKATVISRRKLIQDPVIEEHIFVAHHDRAKISLGETIQISVQLALEDHQNIKIKAIELVEDIDNVTLEELSSPLLIKAFNDMPLIQANVTLLTSSSRFSPAELPQNVTIADLNASLDDSVNSCWIQSFDETNLVRKTFTTYKRRWISVDTRKVQHN